MSEQVSPDEVWKAIPGYEGFYSASSLGRIRRDPDGILKPQKEPKGYVHVCLSKGGIVTQVRVHRLILETFDGIDPLRPHANHLNGLRWDNRYVNLEWATVGDNIRHSFHVLKRRVLIGSEVGHSKLTEDSVRLIRMLKANGVYHCVLANQFGVSSPAISDILSGRTWGHVK